MPSKLSNLQSKAQTANRTKGPLNLDPAKSIELREVLLEIHRVAIQAFDCLEADEVSQHDIFTILTLPVLVNKFAGDMQQHAKEQLARR